VHWPQPCESHARPRLARSAQPPGNQGRVTRQSSGARRSLHNALGSKAGDHRWSSHGDGGPGGMDGPRAPLNRGATVLRLEGRQSGKDTQRRTPTPPVPNREEIKEGGKRKMAAVVLTLGRWCSRGRLEDGRWRGEGIHGGVGVHSGVDVLALVWLLPTRAASSPLLVAAVVVVVLGAPTASRYGRAFPRLDAAAACLLPSSLGVVTGEEGKTPMGLVAWALGLQPRPAFEARCRGRRGESPKLPWLGPAERPRRPLLSPLQPRRRGARCGGKRGSPAPSQV
jgi:hypothetical protein